MADHNFGMTVNDAEWHDNFFFVCECKCNFKHKDNKKNICSSGCSENSESGNSSHPVYGVSEEKPVGKSHGFKLAIHFKMSLLSPKLRNHEK